MHDPTTPSHVSHLLMDLSRQSLSSSASQASTPAYRAAPRNCVVYRHWTYLLLSGIVLRCLGLHHHWRCQHRPPRSAVYCILCGTWDHPLVETYHLKSISYVLSISRPCYFSGLPRGSLCLSSSRDILDRLRMGPFSLILFLPLQRLGLGTVGLSWRVLQFWTCHTCSTSE